MDNNWDNYIQTNIIRPLEQSLQGIDPGVKTDSTKLYLEGKVWYVREKNGQGELLSQYMRPYVEEYLFESHRRMQVYYTADETKQAYWQRLGTSFISDYLHKYEEVVTFFMGRDLHQIVETWIVNHSKGSSIYENRRYLITAVRDGFSTDWEELQRYVVPELKNCPSDYDKLRLEYYCTLDAIIKVALDNNSVIEQKRIYWLQICQSWNILSAIYSVMTGRIIYSGYNHFSPLISHFKTKDKEYAKLMYAALKHHPQVLTNDKARQIFRDIERASKEIKQKTDLNDLCRLLFPTSGWNDYDLETPRLSTAEMMEQIRESQEVKKLLLQVEEYARTLKAELGNAITIQSLREALMKLDPSTARAIYSQLDMVLEGNNEVWDNHRKQLKYELNLRYENEQRMIEGTHQQALLAADYAQQAAQRPSMLKIQNSDVKCEFNGNVGQVIGNVEHLTSNIEE